MDRFIAKQNIERFRQQLVRESDPKRRDVLEQLLEDEEHKLRKAELVHRLRTRTR